MKRSPELIPLSHDHHQALFIAHRLVRGDDSDATRAALGEYWADHGREHFRIEEEILLPAWLDADPDADVDAAERILSEHLEIRRRLAALDRDELDVHGLIELGGLLQAHIRYEERELFPRIESRLSGTTLTALGEKIATAGEDRVGNRQPKRPAT